MSNCLAAFILNTLSFNLPLYFQAVLLETPTSSGMRLLVPSITASCIGAATGFFITWTKRLDWPLICGTVFLVTGTVGISMMKRGMPEWLYFALLTPASMGQGLRMSPSLVQG
jgi:hypothetical protein